MVTDGDRRLYVVPDNEFPFANVAQLFFLGKNSAHGACAPWAPIIGRIF